MHHQKIYHVDHLKQSDHSFCYLLIVVVVSDIRLSSAIAVSSRCLVFRLLLLSELRLRLVLNSLVLSSLLGRHLLLLLLLDQVDRVVLVVISHHVVVGEWLDLGLRHHGRRALAKVMGRGLRIVSTLK